MTSERMASDEALSYYLSERSGDFRSDVIAALRECALRRVEGPMATAAVVDLAYNELKMSYREIEAASFNEARGGVRLDKEAARRLHNRQAS